MDALMLGVSGMRGTVGGTLTPAVVSKLAAAYAWKLKQAAPVDGQKHRVAFGRDSRPSGPFVRDAAVAALTASGVEVVDLGIVTTPGVALMVKHLGCDAGMVATASHNPIEWNGLKLLDARGIAPPPGVVNEIIEAFGAERASFARVEDLVAPRTDGTTHGVHVRRVTETVDALGISARRYKVVLDSVNGAGCVATATLLSKLGCTLVHLNNTPDGRFPHEPEPTAKNLTGLCDAVVKHKAHVGFAQDPDADRLAVVDEHGRYIGEEYSLALAAKLFFARKPDATCVANLSTSRMVDDLAAAAGGRVVRSKVGEANVVEVMLAHGAQIGGEGNGGVIDPRVVAGRDSLVGIAVVLELMAKTGKRVSELVAEVPRYVILKDKFECRREDAERAVAAVKAAFAAEKTDVQDGVRIDWPDAWVHARASNTEPIMRVIAEAPDEHAARGRIDEVQKVIRAAL